MNRKFPWKTHVLVSLFVGFCGYFCAAGYTPEGNLYTMYLIIMQNANRPFENYWNQYSITGIVLFIMIYWFYALMSFAMKKNFMFGREYGSSKLISPEGVSKEIADHDDKREDNVIVKEKSLLWERCEIVNTKNRRLSENLWMSIDTRYTDLNNNIFVLGGSGAGKSFRFGKPNLMQMFGSYIVTDPKGEMLRDAGGFLENRGYKVKVLNLLDMIKSTRYNPFKYIRKDIDVVTLINQMIANTNPKEASASSDPFWEKAEIMLWTALFFYVWTQGVTMSDGTIQRNFPAVMELLKKAEFKTDSRGNKMDSELDKLMRKLEKEEPGHPAVVNYNKCMKGAADTVRSILISANARLATIIGDDLLNLLSEDEMDLASFGREKTVLFCVIPDNDKSYNFIVGMLYSQLFKELYYQADHVYGGQLPIHVTFLFDEFANVALPDDYCSLLSTMRSRNISSIIIVQNMAQIKKLFKDDWETIPGNCDTFIYLGGNEQSTHKYVSELMGKMTIDKRNYSMSRGKQSSTSKSEDALGREIMTPDEVRKLKRRKCLVLISGRDPIIDDKIKTQKHPLWKEFKKTQKDFKFDARLRRLNRNNGLLVENSEVETILKVQKIEEEEYRYEKAIAEKIGAEEPAKYRRKVLQLTLPELLALDLDHMTDEDFFNIDEEILRENKKREAEENEGIEKKIKEEEEKAIHIDELSKDEAVAVLMLKKKGFDDEQIKILIRLVSGSDWESLMECFTPDYSTSMLEAFVNRIAG